MLKSTVKLMFFSWRYRILRRSSFLVHEVSINLYSFFTATYSHQKITKICLIL